jgi:hypothetical protein
MKKNLIKFTRRDFLSLFFTSVIFTFLPIKRINKYKLNKGWILSEKDK